jgi:hypothetical protein
MASATKNEWLPNTVFYTSQKGKEIKHRAWDSISQMFGHSDDIIVMSDAFDTLYQKKHHAVRKAYQEFESLHGRGVVMVSAEKNCWPFTNQAYRPCKWVVPDCSLIRPGDRYLNSGTVIARGTSMPGFMEFLKQTKAWASEDCQDLTEGKALAAIQDTAQGANGKLLCRRPGADGNGLLKPNFKPREN